ncbi:MAG: DNA (cytosine-5-)-methyltransferase, partial [Leeuwenhoekiella sp.]
MRKGKTIIEEVDGEIFKINVIEAENVEQSSYTHFLHNHKNGVSQFYKKDAISFVKSILKKNYPNREITNEIAEESLQYLIFDFKNSIPFPTPKKEKFK